MRFEVRMWFEVRMRFGVRMWFGALGVRLSKAEVPAKLPTACTVDSVVIGRIKGGRVVRSRGVLWS
jgi:hypothetical protein